MRVILLLIVAIGLGSCGPRAAGPGPGDAFRAIEHADLSRRVAAPGASTAQFFVAPQSLHETPLITPPDASAELTEARTVVTVHPMPDDIDQPRVRYDTPVRDDPLTDTRYRGPLPDATPESDRLSDAFREAYLTNSIINRARADVRAADEDVAIARSSGRPTLTLGASAGLQSERDINVPTLSGSGSLTDDELSASVSLEVTQPLFRGFRTRNATRSATAGVHAERERLKATQQDVILATANAFLDVRRFRRGEALREQEVAFLHEQVAAAEARLRYGEGTRTDIDQAIARLGEAQTLLFDEAAAARAAEARFREYSNTDPGTLRLDIDVTKLMPASMSDAVRTGLARNPDIAQALHAVDAANFEVRALEGESLPSVSVSGRVGLDAGDSSADHTESAEVRLNFSMPLYQGGAVAARVRRAKESLSGARMDVDLARNRTRSDIASAWSAYQSSRQSVAAADASIGVARRAVNGLLEELRVGQRTTVDVLDAQRDLIRLEILRAGAERQRDAAAFQVLRQIGELDPAALGLGVPAYDPEEHYVAAKDRWSGFRTPSGS
ncbi:hypothetical protein DLJ53_14880 [Acuticoccus sediminis]|uniref:Outer membrane protein n=1 Tax=Acuticoccus sediminis TaxID=2184697 RepID=A0A8B2NTG7_9HYPH|nr:TolC family outer membrane protein [Acuticoccus sediminis]RAI00545.1 hypothetical protein DLJ53_14880 [Acuticoccus sediminis]